MKIKKSNIEFLNKIKCSGHNNNNGMFWRTGALANVIFQLFSSSARWDEAQQASTQIVWESRGNKGKQNQMSSIFNFHQRSWQIIGPVSRGAGKKKIGFLGFQ